MPTFKSHASKSPLGPLFEQVLVFVDEAFEERDFASCRALLETASKVVEKAIEQEPKTAKAQPNQEPR